jgi:hypothetical protein
MVDTPEAPTIHAAKHYGSPSVFLPDNLLREARRQRGLPEGGVPEVCVLDPHRDMVSTLRRTSQFYASGL